MGQLVNWPVVSTIFSARGARAAPGAVALRWPSAVALAAAAGLTLALLGCTARQPVGEELAESRTRAEVLARLGADPDTNPYEITVEIADGVIRLTGTVGDAADRAEAERIAAAVEGVRQVVNELLLDSATSPTPHPPLDDAAISARVLAKLAADPELSDLAIAVHTLAGEVTLSGRVGSEAERNEAERIARATTGVRAVSNKLAVSPPPGG